MSRPEKLAFFGFVIKRETMKKLFDLISEKLLEKLSSKHNAAFHHAPMQRVSKFLKGF